MSGVRVQITRHVDDSQPGWVEARLRDAWGREWIFVDKAPIFTEAPLGAGSSYPQPGMIACEVIRSWRDEHGREVRTIDTAKPDAIEAESGESRFDVLAEEIIPL
jgi:hypothetical protein